MIVGAGPGNGAAFGRRFASAGYAVALCARDGERVERLAAEIPGARGYACDARDPGAPGLLLPRVRAELGSPDTLIYNAGSGSFGNVDGTSLADFQAAWEVNARGLVAFVQETLPDLRARGGGNVVVIGATASLRGAAGFLAFAAAKAAQRSVAQSLARQLGPERIHVSHVVIDGVIDLERTRRLLPERPDDFFLDPDRIADAVFFLTQQPPSAWTFELDLRPFGERW